MRQIRASNSKLMLGVVLVGLAAWVIPATAVDLLQRYPTTLTGGMLEPTQARPWQFTPNDLFRLSRFRLEVSGKLTVETGPAELGIGHSAGGAICAMLIPLEGGKLKRPGAGSGEDIAHIWLRFHPGHINRLFPPDTVTAGTAPNIISQMRAMAAGKFRASYQAGMNALIPEPKDLTVDIDTKGGLRRFFAVDTEANTAQYVNAFEGQPVRLATASSSRSKIPAPKILFTKPANGAKDVDPALHEITVTFDQDMDSGFSWTGGGPEFPPSPQGAQAEWRGKRTCVLPVKLEPGHSYRVGINSPSHRNFRSVAGDPVEPSSLSFTTK